MAYTKQTWACGDTITAEKLNHMEDGIAQGGGIETNIQNPTDGQTLKYDAESGKWVNGEGGGSGTLVVESLLDTDRSQRYLNKTWSEIYAAMPNVIVLQEGTNEKYSEYIGGVYVENGNYVVSTSSGEGMETAYALYSAESATDTLYLTEEN